MNAAPGVPGVLEPRAPPPYVGRFAPSPTGPLHQGSLATALGSRLDALAHGGKWLLRIEDVDRPREMPEAREAILAALSALGFEADGPIELQSRRGELYERAFERLRESGLVYPCACTRREIADSLIRSGRVRNRHAEQVYPGTCRKGLPAGRTARAWRFRVDDAVIAWADRNGSAFEEPLASEVGDFVLRRADGLWAYQLAVVVDDALQGVTDVVRGEDLIGSTARQILLQRVLGLPTPRYLHLPVVRSDTGEKLSKQTGAAAIDLDDPLRALQAAARHLLDREIEACTIGEFWTAAVTAWRQSRWMGA